MDEDKSFIPLCPIFMFMDSCKIVNVGEPVIKYTPPIFYHKSRIKPDNWITLGFLPDRS